MKGYIKIEATTYEGKESVSYMDRIAMINGVCRALHVTPTELKLMAGLIDSGIMEELFDVNKLKDESVESQQSKKQKFDSDDIVALLKSMLD